MQFKPRVFRPGETIRTGWFGRLDDNMLIRAERVDSKVFDSAEGSVSLAFKIITKNPDEAPSAETTVKDGASEISLNLSHTDTRAEAVVISGTTMPDGLEQEVLIEATCTATDDRNWISAILYEPTFFSSAS